MGRNITMGRRKIEMEYLTDDRVRKVTFCKRKGGLFKKADDLSKLCGCEVAVLIVSTDGVTKALDFASSNTDVNRVLNNYALLKQGEALSMEDEKSRLVLKCEEQRKEIERLNRELTAERTKAMGFGMPGMPSPGTASMLAGLPQQLGMPHFVAPPEVQMTMPMAT